MGFSPSDLNAYLARVTLSSEADQLIREASKGLSRDVGGGSFPCVITEMQSEKLGVTVNTESRRGEFAYAVHLEFDDEVLGFYEQLPPIDCCRTDKNGKQSMRAYRADYAVLFKDEARIIQVKAQAEIQEKLEKYPMDWVIREGRTVDLPAERAFASIGLKHQVDSTADLPPIRVANLKLLLRVRSCSSLELAPIEEAIEKALSKRSAFRLADMALELGIVDLSPFFHLVLKRRIFVDLDHQLLSQPESCLLAGNQMMLQAVNACQKRITTPATLTPQDLEAIPPKLQAERALKNLELLKTSPSSRNARRWNRLIRERSDLSPFQALVPRTYRSGNRLPKRPENVLRFARESLRKYWADTKRCSIRNAHIQYKEDAKVAHSGQNPVTLPTFRELAKHIRVEAAEARGGLRSANAAASPSDVEDRDLKADRPFELASIDHHLAKIYCVLLKTESLVYVCRPIITVLKDCCTREPLAFWIGFTTKRRATAMVLRSCVRRHGRLPEAISCDQGSDFKSVYLSAFLAHYGVHLVIRPKSHSRYGAEIERFFGIFKSRWLDMRPGNITSIKQARSVSGSHKAEKFAAIDLPNLLQEVDDFGLWYSGTIPDTQGKTPSLLRAEGLARFPFSGISIPYDDEFIIASAVDEKKYSLDPCRGIKIGSQHFWNPALGDPSIKRRDLETRLEPEDHSCIYVRVGGQWVTCRSSRSPALAAMDPVYRLAESLLIMDSVSERDAAKVDADSALVQAIRIADARVAKQTLDTRSVAKQKDEPDAVDPWKVIRTSVMDAAPTSYWGTSP